MKKVSLFFLALFLLLVLRIGLFVFVETYSGCGKQPSERARSICDGIAKRRVWSVNGHTFTPKYEMPFTSYRDFWCDLKIVPEDVIVLKTMDGHSEKSITRSLDWLVALLQAETTGEATDYRKNTIFDPEINDYLLRNKCPL